MPTRSHVSQRESGLNEGTVVLAAVLFAIFAAIIGPMVFGGSEDEGSFLNIQFDSPVKFRGSDVRVNELPQV